MARTPDLPPNLLEFLRTGVAHHQAGSFDLAEENYQKVLRAVPDCPEAIHLMGLIAEATGRLELAIQMLEQANRLRPDDPDTLKSLGTLYLEVGDNLRARICYERVVQIFPADSTTLEQLASIHEVLRNYNPAAQCYQQALALSPGNAELQIKLAVALRHAREPHKALQVLEHALVQHPDNWRLFSEAGRILTELGQWKPAVSVLQKAIAINPNAGEAFCNLGYFFFCNRDLPSALESYRRARELEPELATVHSHMGAALTELGELDQALNSLYRARQLEPEAAQHIFNISTIHLLQGDFARGWKEYEARSGTEGQHDERDFDQPQWSGEPLQGASILIHAEQGLGDTMQFVRYLPLVAARGGKVILEVQPGLRRLLTGIEGVAQIISRGDALPDYAWHCPLLSLPLVFQTDMASIPANIPYIRPEKGNVRLWKERLEPAGIRIGLCWSGNPDHVRNRWRSIPLELLAPLTKIENTTFYSLQMGESAGQVAALPQNARIVDLSGEQNDFADTAAIVANLDLVITVDTSIAHLAGSMGKPVWVLLQNVPDWRWLLNRDDSPWYPTARLFRQKVHAQWQDVVSSVEQELRKLQQSAMAAGMAE